jgi:hypothetical protein
MLGATVEKQKILDMPRSLSDNRIWADHPAERPGKGQTQEITGNLDKVRRDCVMMSETQIFAGKRCDSE